MRGENSFPFYLLAIGKLLEAAELLIENAQVGGVDRQSHAENKTSRLHHASSLERKGNQLTKADSDSEQTEPPLKYTRLRTLPL